MERVYIETTFVSIEIICTSKGFKAPIICTAEDNDGGHAMTWSDPIVEEVRRARDAYAARFNYDLRAIFRDLKEQEKRGDRKLVSYANDATAADPDKGL